jgi:P-type conjugative transfer ATPase TrbB
MARAGEHPIIAERRLEALRHALGTEVLAALVDPQIIEIMANPDGQVFVDRLKAGRACLGVSLDAAARERVVRLIADYMGETVTREEPRLAGVLPETGERFQGFLPPVVVGAAFSIRKRPAVIFNLDDYVASGVMTAEQAAALAAAVDARKNILIAGGTSSGKTTLANALLALPGFANDRVFLIEDTPELACSAVDCVAALTRRAPHPVGVADLVRDALRMRPDRIVVGEMRDGAAALETLKAWNTGHPGGLSTIHANSAAEAFQRLEDLIAEVAAQAPTRTIKQAVDVVVFIRRTADGRRVEEIFVPQTLRAWETSEAGRAV